MQGTFWPSPKKKKTSKASPKSRIASQPADNTDYVYFIQSGRQNVFKIGKSNDPQARLGSLQTGSPYKLKLLHTFAADNASAAEEALHAAFQDARMEGEWFRLTNKQKQALLSVTRYEEGLFHTNGQKMSLEMLLGKAQ